MDKKNIYENPVTRTPEYLPEGTLEARMAAVQQMMARERLDVLIALRFFENTDRWLCNAFGGIGPSSGFAVAFPTGRGLCTERNMVTEEEHAEDRNGCTCCDAGGRFIDWASDVDIIDFLEGFTRADAPEERADWLHPTCDLKRALAAGDILARAGKVKTVGVVDPDNMPEALYTFLEAHFPGAEVVDVTGQYCELKAVKSGDDLDVLGAVVRQHDGILGAVAATLVPGTMEREIYNKAKYAAYRKGAGGFNWMNDVPTVVTTFPMDQKWDFQPQVYPGRAIQAGDCVLLRIQSRGMGGYNGAAGRCWTLGTPTEGIRRRWQDAVETEDYCAALLRPGVSIGDVCGKLLAWMDQRGLERPHGNYLHGVGYSLREHPSLEEPASVLREGMVLAVGVPVANRGEGLSPFVCEDMYLVTKDGGKRLTRTPREIIEA